MTALDLFAQPTPPKAEPTAQMTPMMAQYFAVKKQYPEALLFYRMGDFYEMFFDDAVKASQALDIALTKRGQHQGQDIPMCGVPVHAQTGYVARLIKKGFRVAVCEQTETPEEAKKRGGKTLVARNVVRIITPGTLTEDQLLEARANNHLLTLVPEGRGDLAAAWCDLSTGAFWVETVRRASLPMLLARLSPPEVVLPETLAKDTEIEAALLEAGCALTPRPNSLFDHENGRQRLCAFHKVATLEAFGGFTAGEVTAAGALLDYVLLTQVGAVPALRPPARQLSAHTLEIDAATRRNLEFTETMQGERTGSLLATIDETVTAAGARLLANRLSAPLAEAVAINHRLESVAWAVGQAALSEKIRTELKSCPDLERALSRLALGRGGPRDLASIRDALDVAARLQVRLSPEALSPELQAANESLQGFGDVLDKLHRALAQELPLMARDGNFIAKGYAPVLDEVRALRDEGRQHIVALQSRYLEETGLSSLKIKHNNIIGYHVELSAQQAEKLMSSPLSTQFIHRQTMAGAMRFTTTELVQLERDLSQAASRALNMELELFEELRADILAAQGLLAGVAAALALVDVTLALATLALNRRWVRPVVEDSLAFDVQAGRHPVVEAAMGSRFIPNNCQLENAGRLWLLTGPNMAGKSTFLRQNALLVVLAQMGAFVPAAAMRLGVVDRLFSRVGAADDLARGRSTFMVEMVETANILNLSTQRSLVILDEIGRGTATYDGLSIAWAVLEHLHNSSQCRGLFATHYHELTALQLEALACHTLKIAETKGEVVFLHEVVPGKADRSYGLHVAAMAGLPQIVLARAGQLLAALEAQKTKGAALPDIPPPPAVAPPSALEVQMQAIDPDSLTPREALDALYKLKGLLRS